MRWSIGWLAGCVAALAVAAGCGDDGMSGGTEGTASSSPTTGIVICTPGDEVPCGCPGGPPSVQTCRPDGTAYGACDCPGMTTLPPSDSSSSGVVDPSLPPTVSATGVTSLDTSDSLSTTGPADSSDTAGTTDTATTGGVVIVPCDPWMPMCAVGEACKPYSTTGTDVYDANGCFPLDPSPGQVGDPCTPASPGSGEDGCDLGLFCAFVDAVGNGLCVQQCTGTPVAPTCGDPGDACIQLAGGVLNLCLAVCDPFLQDCPGGMGCYPAIEAWTCFADASGAGGVALDPCTELDECDPGSVCVVGLSVPGCADPYCCTALCDTGPGPDPCNGIVPGSTCTEWYAPGVAPPGLETLGVCVG